MERPRRAVRDRASSQQDPDQSSANHPTTSSSSKASPRQPITIQQSSEDQSSGSIPDDRTQRQRHPQRRQHQRPTPNPSTAASASPSSAAKKREQVRHACLHCRNDKVKCSGSHPICTRCSSRALLCSYDVPMEGITKTQHLRQRFADQTEHVDRANSMMDILRHGSDKEATEALARLRFGESVEDVLEYMTNGPPEALQELEAKVQAEMGFSLLDEYGFLKGAGGVGGGPDGSVGGSEMNWQPHRQDDGLSQHNHRHHHGQMSPHEDPSGSQPSHHQQQERGP